MKKALFHLIALLLVLGLTLVPATPVSAGIKLSSLEILKQDEGGKALFGATFVISPNPKFQGTGDLTVVDNGSNDDDLAAGVLLVKYCERSSTQTYTVTETVAPPGYEKAPPQTGIKITSSTKVTLTFVNTPKVHPGLEVTKVADTDISKVGDTITYTITVENTGDGPLTKVSIIDTLLGDISADFANTLASTASESHDFDYVVQPGDPNPLVNEVTATYEDSTGHAVSDTATDTVDLVHPNIEVTKTADPTSGVVGDEITYTITVTNTGDVELENITVTDSLLGDLSASFADSLISGASDTQTFPRIIGDTDPDPLVNTVTVHANPISLTNDITDSDSAEVDLVSPGLEVTKVADTDISKVGDTITYTITVENTGDDPLTKVSIIDTLLGNISADFANTLASTASESHDFDYVVQPGDPNPLVNEVTATYEDSAGNAVSDTATDSVDLVHPSIEVTKTADPTSAVVGDTITYTITVTNTGDVELENITVTDSLLGDLSASFADSLISGASDTQTFPRIIGDTDPDPLVNTVTVHANPISLTNDITDWDDASVDLVNPAIEVVKTVCGQQECGCDRASKVTALTLKYNGGATALIEVRAGTDVVFGPTTVDPDGTFSFSCAKNDGTFGNEIEISVYDPVTNELLTVTSIHTSCSKPIRPGLVYDDFVVIEGWSADKPLCPGGDLQGYVPCDCPGEDALDVSIGDTVTYCYEVTNIGDVTLYNVTLMDDMGTPLDTSDDEPVTLGTTTLAPGESTTGTLAYEVVTGDAPSRCNVATVTGTTSWGQNVTDTDPSCIYVALECGCEGKVSFLRLQYNGTLVDVVVTAKDGHVLYTGTVNQGDQFEFDCFKADGNLDNEITISVTGGSVNTIHTSCSKPIGPGLIVGDFEVVEGESLDGGLLWPLCPYIEVVKTASSDGSCPGSDPLNVSIDDTVTYCYEVTNIGDVTLYNVTLVDDMGTPLDTSDDEPVTLVTNTLGPGESTTGTLTHVVVTDDAPSKTNTATATGETEIKDKVYEFSDADDCTINVAPSVTCVGRTPEYWMDWGSNYTQELFLQLLDGTYVATIEGANFLFALYGANLGIELINLGAHLLATQLTLNLGTLTEGCQVQWNSETWTVGDAVEGALNIVNNPSGYTSDDILKLREILEMINNLA